jgi:membrane fusion protein, multidrug efflux system
VLSIPSSALIFNAKGLSVAIVDAHSHVTLKPVSVGRDLGKVVELASGLWPEDKVIENPPDGVSNGDLVRIIGAGADGNSAPQSKNEKS